MIGMPSRLVMARIRICTTKISIYSTTQLYQPWHWYTIHSSRTTSFQTAYANIDQGEPPHNDIIIPSWTIFEPSITDRSCRQRGSSSSIGACGRRFLQSVFFARFPSNRRVSERNRRKSRILFCVVTLLVGSINYDGDRSEKILIVTYRSYSNVFSKQYKRSQRL